LVARLVRDEKVGGSNPLTPILLRKLLGTSSFRFLCLPGAIRVDLGDGTYTGSVSSDKATLMAAGRLAGAGEPFVLVTVIKVEGSTPRDADHQLGRECTAHARTPEFDDGVCHDMLARDRL
jgi:hypothetical protein